MPPRERAGAVTLHHAASRGAGEEARGARRGGACAPIFSVFRPFSPARRAFEQPGVNAPGTANRMPRLPAKMERSGTSTPFW